MIEQRLQFVLREKLVPQDGWRNSSAAREIALFLFPVLFLLSNLAGAVGLWAEAAPDTAPRVIFTKEFPHSQPDYYSVTVYENGRTLYRTAPDDNSPLEFQLPPETAGEIFRLARKLNWFKNAKLESKRRVANMGKKTLTYQKGDERYSATFNYTQVPAALALMASFEKLSQTEQHLLQLKNQIRYDKLGVVRELLQVEIDLDHNRLLAPRQLIPVLEQIRKDPTLAHIAQERAVQILGKIESGTQAASRQ